MVIIIFHNGTVMGHDILKVPGLPIGQLKKALYELCGQFRCSEYDYLETE